MEIQFLDIINILTPVLGIVVGWFFGRRKQKNDFLSELQASIDLLASKNTELLKRMIELSSENSKLQIKVDGLTDENTKLRIEVEELNRKLEGVKTITKSKVNEAN